MNTCKGNKQSLCHCKLFILLYMKNDDRSVNENNYCRNIYIFFKDCDQIVWTEINVNPPLQTGAEFI